MSRFSQTFALSNQIGMTKADLDEQAVIVSDGNATSLGQLSTAETNELNRTLRKLCAEMPQDIKLQTQKRKLCAIFHELKFEKENGKLDYNRINQWLRKYTDAKRPLNAMNHHQTTTAITQAKQFLKHTK